MDLLAVEGMVGALNYSPPSHLLTGEGDQGLAAALATEVVQNENGIWLELQKKLKIKRKKEKNKEEKIIKSLPFHAVATQKHQGEPIKLRREKNPMRKLVLSNWSR